MKLHNKNYSTRRACLFGFLLSAASLMQADDQLRKIYVSASGTAEVQPDGSMTKPYQSIPGAVSAVRALRQSGLTAPVVVYLRGGRHQLSETLVLGIKDGAPTPAGLVALGGYGAGNIANPPRLTLAAYPGETPVVSAGVPVVGWKKLQSVPPGLPASAAGKVWVADMPQGMERFYTLYDDRGRLQRARNSGFFPEKPGDRTTLHFPKGALKNWDNVDDVEIHIRPGRAWTDNMLPLASVDEAAGIAKTAVSATYEMSALPAWVHNSLGASVWVENILEALDEPGEWVVNTKTRKIYLWPSDPAPDGSPRGVLAPSTSELIRVEGAIDYDGPTDSPVREIAFVGLTFSHADRWAWTNDETRVGWGLQHDWEMFDRPTALLRFRGAEDCRVIGCRFVASGGSGVRMDLYAQRNRVEDCEFAHLGEAGILLAGYGPGMKDVNQHNDILNNHIHHFSEIMWRSPGVWAWQSGHNRIAHNEIHDSGYAAVLITTRVIPSQHATGEGGMTVRRNEIAAEDRALPRGGYASWLVREKYTHSRYNLVEYNEISHTVEKLSDGNGIYVSGGGAGNIVRSNYLHDNLAESITELIRCDDDQHDTLIYGNILYHNSEFSAGISSKGHNDIINNFIVAPLNPPRWGYISLEWVPVTGSKISRNIIISHPDGGKAVVARPRNPQQPAPTDPTIESTEMDMNLYYHPTDSHWMDEHFSKMRAVGKEQASRFGDPLFNDPTNGDFGFKPGSPALKLGIEPLDVSKMGRIKNGSLRVSDGAAFLSKDHSPKFSWGTVPTYYMFGDSTRLLKPEEVKFIAERTDFICIEKSHGLEPLGAADLGTKHEVEAFKKIKPDIKVLFYFNSAWAWPFTSFNKNYTPERINDYPQLKNNLLVNPATGALHYRDRYIRHTYAFDVLKPEFREWWVEAVAKGVESTGCDGAFIDQMHGFYTLREDRTEEVKRAQGELIAALKKRLGPDKIVLGNNVHQAIADYVFPAVDASMFEHYSGELLSKEQLLQDWDDMLRFAQAGKMSVFRIGVGQDPFKAEHENRLLSQNERTVALARERLEYHLACFLIGAQPYSYFQYGWGWDLADGSLYDFPELHNRLGPPMGAYQRTTQGGWEFTREFEHASVWLDTEKGQAKITWR